jgi:hypothetical protein
MVHTSGPGRPWDNGLVGQYHFCVACMVHTCGTVLPTEDRIESDLRRLYSTAHSVHSQSLVSDIDSLIAIDTAVLTWTAFLIRRPYALGPDLVEHMIGR